jgi:hypothetical protein
MIDRTSGGVGSTVAVGIGGEGERVGAGAPEELYETVVDVLAEGDDAVEGFGPDDEGAFVTLGNEVVSII